MKKKILFPIFLKKEKSTTHQVTAQCPLPVRQLIYIIHSLSSPLVLYK